MTEGHALMPNALRLSVAVAENPAVRRNGGSGWRLSALNVTSMHRGFVTPRRVRSPQTFAWSASAGSIFVETKCASGWRFVSSRLVARTASFHFASPRSRRSSGTRTSRRALAQSSRSNTSVPVLPETVPIAFENPAWSIANSTRVWTGSIA